MTGIMEGESAMPQPTVLMIDDNELERLIFSRIMSQSMPHCRLVTAGNATEGLRVAGEESPDCALIDLNMPDMDGIELCRRLKSNEATAHFPIILITAQETDADLRAQGLEAGADEFLQRPAEKPELLAKLHVMLRVKRAEDELRSANRRLAEVVEDRSKDLRFRDHQFRVLFEVCSDAAIVCDLAADAPGSPIIRNLNGAACRLLGLERDALDNRTLDTLLAGERTLRTRIEVLYQNRSDTFESEVFRSDGTRVPVLVHATLFEEENRSRLLFVCHPLDTPGAEGQSRRMDIGYNLLAVDAGQVIYDHDLSTALVSWEGAMEQVTGRPLQDFQQAPMAEWRELVHVDDWAVLEQHLSEALTHIGRYQVEYRVSHAAGGWRHVEELGLVLADAGGAAYRVLGTIKDITARVEAERERRQRDVESMHSKRLESLGVLAGGIAHDFNNLLTGIIGLTDLCLQNMDPDDENFGDLEEALQAGHRAKDLVRQILAFSRQSSEEKSPLYLHVVARECIKLLRGSLPPNIELIDAVDTQSGAISANATQMHQVIMNCCTNAIQAMAQDGGKIELRVADMKLEERDVVSQPQLRPGMHVCLSITDQGPGMPPDVLSRVFDPFFTTKGVGEGTGMGLAAVHGIVTEHRGAVHAESMVGRGTSVHAYFPRLEEGAEIRVAPQGAFPAGSGRLLLVDDEMAILHFAKSALTRAGYEVTACASGYEALEHFNLDPDSYALCLTDQGMPRMSGTDLSAALKKIRPKLPVIIWTGFQEPLTDAWMRDSGVLKVVRKPIMAAELAWTVHDALHGATQRV